MLGSDVVVCASESRRPTYGDVKNSIAAEEGEYPIF